MQFNKFEEWMVGQSVTDGLDNGILKGSSKEDGYGENAVWVEWADGVCRGDVHWSELEGLEFINVPCGTMEEITIDGKRYKLVPVKNTSTNQD